MINLAKIFKKEYRTLNKIEVSNNNLLRNYKYLSSINKKFKIAPVIKSNGYGHGLINVASILESQNPPFFCVDSLYEAYELMKAGIKTKILITGYTNPQNLRVKKLPFSFAVFTNDLLQTIAKYQPEASVHIFVDTGMRREGITIEELPGFLNLLKQYPSLKVAGIMSHLASTQGKNDPLFNLQIKHFKEALRMINNYKIKSRWIHIAASGGLINKETNKVISQISNMSRTGLALYGLGDDKNLKPVLKLITNLGQIKLLKKGETTGYDGTYKAKKDLIIGILPIGYNDGVDRRLSNKGIVTIRGVACPIIGKVSMNIITVDLSKVPNSNIGEEVIIYSNDKYDKNSIENTAKICKTIPYDILIGLAASTKRIIV